MIERGGRVLAAQRVAVQSNGGLWEFPGGKVAAGESPEAALVREIIEELGVTVAVGRPLAPHTHAYPGKTIELMPFLCAIDSGEPRAHEHAEIRWVDREEAKTLVWAEADIPILEEYLG